MFQLKDYQQQALTDLRDYFRLVNDLDDADGAYYKITGRTLNKRVPYQPVPGFEGMPYVCIRIPTGGGKTYVAAHAVGTATNDLLGADRSVVLWLVPTSTILEQTIEALQTPGHPYRRALEQHAPSVRVISVSDALEVNRATLDTATTVIVATMQSFRITETEGRKVYEDAGALMDHFSDLAPEQTHHLEAFNDGTPKRSLANVLRLRHPIVIVDEAHNARTPLSFETLRRFAPSCIIEFTATPDLDERPSNVLTSASAAELKDEDMIKLPIELTVKQPWKELLGIAIEQRDHLEAVAEEERNATGEYIRPIMLIKAESARGSDPLTPDVVADALREEFQIPDEQIAIEYKSHNDLEGVDLSDPACPIRYAITVQKLGEGWDCPFAYVLCSVAAMRSNQAIEQIVGRVLRMPNVQRKQHDALNKAYAFGANDEFTEALTSVRDVLVQNGFERQEADTLVRKSLRRQQDPDRGYGPLFEGQEEAERTAPTATVTITYNEAPDLNALPDEPEGAVDVDADAQTLTYQGPLNETDRQMLNTCFEGDAEAQDQVDAAYRTIREEQGQRPVPPVEREAEPFTVPQLAIEDNGTLDVFEKTHILDRPWSLSDFTPKLPNYEPTRPEGQRGTIDTDDDGRIRIASMGPIQRQLALLDDNSDWTVANLVAWLDRSIPHQDITPQDATTYLERLIQRHLIEEQGYELNALIRDKYRLKRAVESRIHTHRNEAHKQSFQTLLYGNGSAPKVTVSPEIVFQYQGEYVYRALYDGPYTFNKHYYGPDTIGDMNGEEAQCASFIDGYAATKHWVRNPEQKPRHAFWMQTATGKFYPDFVCQLRDGRTLVVEYKGSHLETGDPATEKENVGQVWAERSGGACLFVMARNNDYGPIRAVVEE